MADKYTTRRFRNPDSLTRKPLYGRFTNPDSLPFLENEEKLGPLPEKFTLTPNEFELKEEDINALTEDDIENLGASLMKMFSGDAPKELPRAQKTFKDSKSFMPNMEKPLMDPKSIGPQPSPTRNKMLSPPVVGKMPARASRRIKSMLNQRYNQPQQPNIYAPLGAQQPMMQQAPFYMFDPTQAR
jgi:hypothetical protein